LAAESLELFDFVENITAIDEIPSIIFNRLTESYRKYQLSGGMPEAVANLLDNKGLETVEESLQIEWAAPDIVANCVLGAGVCQSILRAYKGKFVIQISSL
jgi:hypothetical protein